MKACIRPAAAADLPRWAAMRAELWPDWGEENHRADAAATLARPEWGVFVAEDALGLVAFMELSLRPFANGCESRPVAFLEGIWVAPRGRRGGLGRRLIAAAEAWAAARGSAELGSDVELDNRESQAAHAAWGFAETERVVYFRKPVNPSA